MDQEHCLQSMLPSVTTVKQAYIACSLQLQQLNKTVSHHGTSVLDLDPTIFFFNFQNAPKIKFFLNYSL
jgi:hypothetical protein